MSSHVSYEVNTGKLRQFYYWRAQDFELNRFTLVLKSDGRGEDGETIFHSSASKTVAPYWLISKIFIEWHVIRDVLYRVTSRKRNRITSNIYSISQYDT